jgi:hypothetical protein
VLDEKPERLPPQAWLVEHARDSGAHVKTVKRVGNGHRVSLNAGFITQGHRKCLFSRRKAHQY